MGLINQFINRNKTPMIVHGNFCGPGNDVISQIATGVRPVTDLDSYCKDHDLAYVNYPDLEERHKADRILAKKALSRFKNKEATLKERLAGLVVGAAMKGKLALGAGLKCSKKSCSKNVTKRKTTGKRSRRGRSVRGGFLPALVPILAGLSAIGGIGSGVSQMIKNVKDVRRGDLELEEMKRHNMAMERSGSGHRTRSSTTLKNHRAGGKRKMRKTTTKTRKLGKGFIIHQYKRC